LLTAVLARQAAAVVGVGTCWPWETAATSLLGGTRRFGAHGEERGRGISWQPPTYSLLFMLFLEWYCWLGDRKGIRPVRNLTPAISKGSSLRVLWGRGITWSDHWNNRPVKQKLKIVVQKWKVVVPVLVVSWDCVFVM